MTLALPYLESVPLLADDSVVAGNSGAPAPLRYMNVFFASGIGKHRETGWNASGRGDSFKLGTWLKSLEPFKDQIVEIRNTFFRPGAHRGLPQYLSPYQANGQGEARNKIAPGGPYTIDQVIADAWMGSTELHCLALGTDNAVKPQVDQTAISWRAGAAVPRLVNPGEAFDSLFDGPSRRAQTRSILDLVREQTRSLESKASHLDRQRLDEYQNAIRDIERKLEIAERDRPAGAWQPSLTEPDMKRPTGELPTMPEYQRLMLDIALLAFRMDKTRVITFMFNNESSERTYPHLGLNAGHHGISHGTGGPEAFAKVTQYQNGMLAEFLHKCRKVDEGDGTLFDHLCLHYGSDMQNGGHSGADLPLLLIGGACGRMKGARTIDGGGHPISHANFGVLHMLGFDHLEHWGDVAEPVTI